jgi:hypothetical protein
MGLFLQKTNIPPPELAPRVGCGPASVQAWGRMSFNIWGYDAPKPLVAKN